MLFKGFKESSSAYSSKNIDLIVSTIAQTLKWVLIFLKRSTANSKTVTFLIVLCEKQGKLKYRGQQVSALGPHELSTKGFKATEIHGLWFRFHSGTPKLHLNLWASSLINSRNHQNHFRIPIARANL